MPDLSPMEIVFWIIILLIFYTLKGYPILLAVLAHWKREPVYSEPKSRPMVSFIVAAYNEEKNISTKLKNLGQIEYDPEKIEFIVGSDASNDGTDRVLAEAAQNDSRLKYFRVDQRSGKIAVLNRAVQRAKGDLLVFTDCSVKTDTDIMPVILSSFTDAKVGLVSSRDIWVDDVNDSPITQHQYIDYEMKIRKLESRINSVVTASGSFFAVRRELFKPYDCNQADDFALPLQVYRQGYKVIHRDELVGYVPMVKSPEAEYRRRTRIVQAGIRTVLANLPLLNPLKYPVFAWQLWSHKVLKWILPFWVITSLVLASLLWYEAPIYRLILLAYLLVILAAILPGRIPKLQQAARFLFLSMGAVLTAWFRIFTGKGVKTWEPSHR